MISQRLAGLAVAVAVCLEPRAASATSILVNGDFQTGNLAGWTPFTTPSGTNGSALPDVIAFDTTGGGSSLAAHFDVGQSVSGTGQQGGGISQSFVALTAGIYDFSADIASQDDIANAGPNGDAGTFTILIDGSALTQVSLGGFSFQHQIIRSSLSGSLALAAGNHTFALQITRGFISSGDLTPTQYIDNIVGETASTSEVPEPTSMLLVASGLLGLSRARRRRSARR